MLAQQRKKEQREEMILSSLDNLVYATRKQLQIVNKLGGDRNAHRILHRMEKDHLLSSIRTEKKIYFLSNKGKNVIASNQGDLKKSHIQHNLMRNDLYIKLGMPASWKKEQPVSWNDNKLIPDATFKTDKFNFVEIDNLQNMKTNIDKLIKYKDLSEVIYSQYNHKPLIIWFTLSQARKDRLEKECIKLKLNYKMY